MVLYSARNILGQSVKALMIAIIIAILSNWALPVGPRVSTNKVSLVSYLIIAIVR